MSHPYIPKRDESNTDGALKKRRKGATRLSCAECRRLKLRCDRSIPCGSCVKRGCGAICPDGSLTTGQGNRFVLASTQELHEKISELANRVRELEDGLRTSHAHLSTEQHPLLTEELLRIKAPLQREPPTSRNSPSNGPKEEEYNPDVVDAFGSLSIGISGRTKYFGHIANSWYFLQNESPEEDDADDRLVTLQNMLPREVLERSQGFPMSPTASSPVMENERVKVITWLLPPAERAAELRSIYFRFAAWMYNPISPECFDEQIYSQFYDASVAPPTDSALVSHRLSLMFMVLAIGNLMDISQPAYNIEAEKFHQLARAALFQNSLFEEPTISAVQALYLMSFYLFLSDRHGTGSGTRWSIMGIAVKLAQSIGLHRDSGRWKVDAVETQRRRELFWELYTYDSWQCLTFGRPPSFALAHVDCQMPHLGDPTDDQSFHAWKHRFCSECMSVIHDQAFSAKTPSYATVLQLDRKLRAFPVPPILQVAGFGSSEPRPGGFPESIMLTLQRHIVLAIREMNLLYLHRSFFARAVSDHPKDPLGSPYGTSVIAAYRSAGSLVALMRNLHTQLKEPSERMWFLWTHMFSCAIVLGSIVTRCPSMSLAPSALVQLDSACELFSKAARGFRAQKVLAIMLRLQDKAHISLDDFRKGIPPNSRRGSMNGLHVAVEQDDELSVLGGKTRLVAKMEPHSPSLMNRSPTSLNPIVPLPLMQGSGAAVHPSVIEYLQTFAPPQPPASLAHANAAPSFADTAMFDMPSFHNPAYDEDLTTPTYNHHQHMEAARHHQPHQPHTTQSQPMIATGNFPQYFPVFDYTAPAANGFPSMTESPPRMSGMQRRSSNSPEANMHTTWQDFVAGLGMN